MKILAIETSCDDTAIAILEVQDKKYEILSNIVSSQIEIHKKYGGVFPMMAKREHQKNLIPVTIRALQKANLIRAQNSNLKNQSHSSKLKIIKKILEREPELFKQLVLFLEKYKKPDVDLIAVTSGPGLEPCLWVGVNFARALSYFWDIPIVPVNHIEAHILVNFMKHETWNMKQAFPVIALVVSGGHTQLILMKKIGDYEIIGETRDDAAGECFDKCAKILGLKYPGGPAIAKFALQWKSQNPKSKIQILNFKLPRPMISTKDYDFSFSGLKTAVLYKVKELKIDDNFIKEMCFQIQQAIIDVLIKKVIKAAKDFKVKTVILGGGVSANQELRKQLKQKIKKDIPDTRYLIPDSTLSTDNALMIAVTGYFHRRRKINPSASSGRFLRKIEANANLRISK